MLELTSTAVTRYRFCDKCYNKQQQGVTPMTAARENAHTDIIEELCKSGAEKVLNFLKLFYLR